MDPQSTLGQGFASSALEVDGSAVRGVRPKPQPSFVARTSPASVSAQIAAANLLEHSPSGKAILNRTGSPNAGSPNAGLPSKEPRFPGEDGGRSLAEMADRDLDAALQLLADRAQYITGASGAAIALRRGAQSDMLCRASAGTSAPELGAILSMEYGLSGESVRTGRALRCDDAESDFRVNREVCRQLGIASVVVMPIVSERQILGVFELFSGKPRAFDERDLAALQRLSEMVETAIHHAIAAQAPLPPPDLFSPPNVPQQPALQNPAALPVELKTSENRLQRVTIPSSGSLAKVAPPVRASLAKEKLDSPGKPLLWSAAIRTQRGNGAADEKKTYAPDPMPIPPVLRKLQKCQACGFPVSPGRTFCVECEEKHWRGEQLQQLAADHRDTHNGDALSQTELIAATPAVPSRQPLAIQSISVQMATLSSPASDHFEEGDESKLLAAPRLEKPIPGSIVASDEPAGESFLGKPASDQHADILVAEAPTPFLASAVSSESWFAAHKYILAVLFLVAIVMGAFAYLR